MNRYGFEIVQRMYGQFLAFLFYRWEVIMRETAILGVLGIATRGLYIDSAIADMRLDCAMLPLRITALLNLRIRQRKRPGNYGDDDRQAGQTARIGRKNRARAQSVLDMVGAFRRKASSHLNHKPFAHMTIG